MEAKSPMVPALHILDLSPDVLSLVLRHLNTEDILQLEMTCKYLALAVKESDAYKFGLQNFLGIDASETKAQRLSRLRMLPRIHRRKIPRYGIHTATQASALDLDDEVRPLETDPFHVTAKYLLEHEIGAANETLATNYSSFPYLHSSQFWKRLALWLTYKQHDAVSAPQIGLQLSTKNRDIPLDSFRYIEHADAYSAPSSSRPSNYQTFTITGWFYIDPQLLIQYDHESDDDATGHPLVYLVSDDTKGRLGFRDTYNCCVLYFDHLTRRIFTAHEVYGPVETFTSLQEIECGKWFHIAFSSYKVWNKDFASLYVNGQSYGVQFEHPGFSASSKTRPQVFVASYATGRRNPLIKHSQILVYNNKLSDNDIALLASIAPSVQTQAKSHDFGEPSLGTTEHVEHTGYGCDSCNMYPARGLIFKCMACRASYDLCSGTSLCVICVHELVLNSTC
mmetsp:Transcript_3954/g.7208  ORF Transcript_3954/g.7208 Transcript_3954/m.7208 type:complete len:451 (-) Transcript_3954:424-1776(-)